MDSGQWLHKLYSEENGLMITSKYECIITFYFCFGLSYPKIRVVNNLHLYLHQHCSVSLLPSAGEYRKKKMISREIYRSIVFMSNKNKNNKFDNHIN